MNNIIKSLLILLIIGVSSCELTNLDHLENPNAVTPDNAEISLFFNSIQLDFKDFFMNASDQTMPVVRMMAMTGGNTYNNAYSPTSFNFMWNRAYSDLFPDIDQLISIATEDGIPTYAGAGKLMKAYIMMTLVDLYGDIPMSEAGQGVSLPSPAADDQASVYQEALGLINSAITDFGTSGPPIGSNDLFYGGDHDKWSALANSMKLKYYITTRLVEGSAGSEINGLVDKVIKDGSGDFQFNFGTNRVNPDSRHWFYARHYENGATDYQSNYYMWSLNSEKGIQDPRTNYYFFRQDLKPEEADAFTLDCNSIPRPLHYTGAYPWCTEDGGYWGRDHGNNDGIPPDTDRRTVSGVYPGGGKFDNGEGGSVQNAGKDGAGGQGIAPIMLSSFVQFMLAEAALELGVTGDPRAYLEAGIRQSIAKVMSFGALDGAANSELFPSEENIEEYVALVLSNYDAADQAGQLDIIMKEYHIALWGNGIEAFNGYRRTGYPSGLQPTREANSGDFTRSMFYPADYVNLNANANQKEITDQVFWDTNPAGFIE